MDANTVLLTSDPMPSTNSVKNPFKSFKTPKKGCLTKIELRIN
jgi:hypothetical protein